MAWVYSIYSFHSTHIHPYPRSRPACALFPPSPPLRPERLFWPSTAMSQPYFRTLDLAAHKHSVTRQAGVPDATAPIRPIAHLQRISSAPIPPSCSFRRSFLRYHSLSIVMSPSASPHCTAEHNNTLSLFLALLSILTAFVRTRVAVTRFREPVRTSAR